MFDTGIHITKNKSYYTLVACTYPRYNKPSINLSSINFNIAKNIFSSLIIVHNNDLEKGINSAYNRTFEQLSIKDKLIPKMKPDVRIIVNRSVDTTKVIPKIKKHKKHWLLNASKELLSQWLLKQGQHE